MDRLRVFPLYESYKNITNKLKMNSDLIQEIKNRNNKDSTDIKTLGKLMGIREGLMRERRMLFTSMLMILIAVLGLFISVLALLVRK